MRKLLTLNKDGKLALRSGDGSETIVERCASNVLILLDTSGSMAGHKLLQAKSGAVDFGHSASAKGFATALAVFGDRAAMVCDPSVDTMKLARKLSKVEVGIVGGSTNLAAGLILAEKFKELSVVVVVTDGASNDNGAALDSAAMLKKRGVEIICIGTDDADKAFLARLATRSDFASYVPAHSLRSAITGASRLLKRG
jgi:Mg-chelatase subunit ChlD